MMRLAIAGQNMIMIMSDFALQEFWVEHGRERCLAAGETLFRKGDAIEQLRRVEHGLIALVRPLPQGADLNNSVR